MSIRIFVADDHGVVREGLCALLNNAPDFEVVGEADNGLDAIKKIRKLRPDIVVMDIAMPLMNGIQATHQLCRDIPEIPIIALSMHDSSEYIFRALSAGVRGYVLKDSAGTDLAKAIDTVYAGKRYFCPKVSDTLVSDYLRQRTKDEEKSPLSMLSEREQQVLQLVAEGYTSLKIGEIMALSPKTIDSYRSRIMKKLDLHNLPQLVKFALQHGLTSLS